MKWKSSVLCVDLNESKLNVREDTDKHFEIVPKLLLEPDDEDEDQLEHEADGIHMSGQPTTLAQQVVPTRVISATPGGPDFMFGIALNSDFLVLSPDLDGVRHVLNFEGTIDFLLWRRSVILIGLSTSEILLINPNTFEISESRKVCPSLDTVPERFFVDGFIHSNPNPTKIDFVAVGVDGTVYASRNISLSTGLLDSTHDENVSIDIDCATIRGSIQRCLPEGAQVISTASPGQNFFITAEASGELSLFSSTQLKGPRRFFRSCNLIECLELEGSEICIKKIVHCEGLLFVLLSNGRLEILLDEELIPTGCVQLPMRSCIVQDFQLVVSSAEIVKMWVIFSNVEENDHFIAILPGPKFQIEFLVRIPATSDDWTESRFKFPNSASQLEEPSTFIEIGPDGSTKVYEMTEVSADISLQNLLVKGNFGKAELLARKYTKDMDIVWKAKLKSKYAHMMKAETEGCEADFREIVATLVLIRDPEYVCDFCTRKGFSRFEWIKELLGIGIKRVTECSGTPSGIHLLQRRKALYTFEQVSSTLEITKWNEFISEGTTMFDQSVLFLKNLEFDKAEIVWLRHCHEFISEVDLQDFVPFFKTLFMKQQNCPEAVSLLRTIFPYAVEKCEAGTDGDPKTEVKIGALIGLVRAQIRALERSRDWPDGAIEFLNVVVTLISDEMSNLEREASDGEEQSQKGKLNVCREIKTQLEKIIQSLKELGQLIRSHSIRISFEEYTTSSLMDAVNTMLRVLFSREEVELFVREFLIPFAIRYGLDKDEIFKIHVKAIASDVPYFMTSGSIPFEERIVTLIDFIGSPRTKLDCIQIMAEEWPVPWCSVMDSAVKKCLDMNVQDDVYCRNVQKTVELMRIQVPFRVILQKYRLAASRLTLAFNVKHTISRMLQSRKENCFEDCLELIKHTGKCDANGVKYIKFWYELSQTNLPLEDIVDQELSEELARSFLVRILHQFNMGETLIDHSEELWCRYGACGRILANRLDDQKALEFFKLRDLIPNLWRSDIIYSLDFPFSTLQLTLENEHMEPSSQIVASCHNLSRLTFSHSKDMLVLAASFYAQPGMARSALSKIWDILLHIVQLPGLCHDTRIVPFAGIRVIQHLTHFAPTTSTAHLNVLHNFCRLMMNSFDGELIEPVAKLVELILIFQDLRDQEIPLEDNFLDIYKEVWPGNWKGIDALLTSMQCLGESLLRFGSVDLFLRIFHAVQREYMNQAQHSAAARRKDLMEGASKVETLRKSMKESMGNYAAEEANPRVVSLVKSLEELGFTMNAYALRQRNKGKLIGKLVDMNCFMLAAQTALVFDFKDHASWSVVLQQFINKGTVLELKNLLESLKRITELWVLPEFATAWLRVAEKFPNFKHMCPIPLD